MRVGRIDSQKMTQRQIGLKAVAAKALPRDPMHFDEDKVKASPHFFLCNHYSIPPTAFWGVFLKR